MEHDPERAQSIGRESEFPDSERRGGRPEEGSPLEGWQQPVRLAEHNRLRGKRHS